MVGQERDAVLGLLALGDVHHHTVRVAGHASIVANDRRLVVHPYDVTVPVEHPVLEAEGLARLMVPLVLGDRAGLVVRMEQTRPHPRVRRPLLWGVSEELLDLRADEEGRRRLIGTVDVGHRGSMLDHRTVLFLREPSRLVGESPLQRCPERPGHGPERVDLALGPSARTMTVVERQEPPPFPGAPYRNGEHGHDVLVLEQISLRGR